MFNLLSFRLLIYNIFVNVFIPFITIPANVIRFGISVTQLAALNSFISDWNTKFAAYTNPLTYGRASINAIHTAFQSGYALTQGIRTKIRTDTSITLTTDEREICNLPVPNTSRTRTLVPKTSPALACFMISYLLMKFVALNPLLLFKKAKPPGISFIGYKIAITAPGAPAPRPDDYEAQEPVTGTEFEMVFTADQVGKTLYIIAYYINSKNEAGPDGIPVMVTIG